MGLLAAAIGATGGVLADQWKELFYCDALETDVLVEKGKKRTGKRSSNTKGSDNIISNGSAIAVNEGQCMMIVEQGKIVEFCAQPGQFLYDTSSEPSLFCGPLGENLKKTFRMIGSRIGFGGDTGKDQRVYYFNTKEIVGNKYGTPNPVPFRVTDANIGLDVDISIRCHGEYSYKLVDPLLFYTNVCGNVEDVYTRDELDDQLKSELMTALQPAFARISDMGIRYSALPGHTTEMADALNHELSQKWANTRGIAIAAFGISSVTASPEDEAMIKELQKSAVLRDPRMAAAALTGAQAAAMQAAAANTAAGPVMAFAGMNMAQNAGGVNAADLFAMGAAPTAPTASAMSAPGGWACACGATGNTGNFCANCGKQKPEADTWVCACGAQCQGKFCANCGKQRPSATRLFRCNKCGWTPPDPMQPPKFCPNCGDAFNDVDTI